MAQTELELNLKKLGTYIVENQDQAGSEDFDAVAKEYRRLESVYENQQSSAQTAQTSQPSQELIPFDGETMAPDSREMTPEETQQVLQQSFSPQAIQQGVQERTGAGADFARSFGVGAQKFGAGVTQLALEGAEAVGVPGADVARQEFTDDWQNYFDQEEFKGTDSPLASTLGDVGGQIVPLFLSPIKTGPNLIPKVLKNAGEFAALESMLFKDEGESRLMDATEGAGVAALVTTLFHGAGKTVNAVTRSKAAKQVSEEMKNLSKQLKVPLTVGQLKDSRPIKMVEGVLNQIPIVGTMGFAQKQFLAFEEAAERMVKQIGGEVDSVGKALNDSLKRVLKKNKETVDAKYNKVQQAVGDGPQALDNINAEAKKISNNLKVNIDFLGQQSQQQTAQRAVKASTPEKVMSQIVDRLGNQIQLGVNTKTKTYAELRALRTEYGRMASKAVEGLKNGQSTLSEVKALIGLRKAVEKDLEVAARNAGSGAEKLSVEADAAYKNLVLPFKKGPLRKSVAEGVDLDSILQKFVKRDKTLGSGQTSVKQLFANTDEGGKQAVKYSILKDAWEEASKKGEFDPQRFSNILEQTSGARKVIFTGTEKQEIDGFIKLANLVPSLAQQTTVAANYPARRAMSIAVGSAAGGATIGSLGLPAFMAGGTILGGMAGVSFLLTSNTGRAILRAAPKVKDASAMEKLVAKANSLIAEDTAMLVKSIPSTVTKGVAVLDDTEE